MPIIDDAFKNELRNRIELSTYIGKFLRLQKSGSTYKACCPFHNEKTPSFHINPEYYHCFGCGESGDLIKFCMKYENLDFVSAVKHLADIAGMEIPDMTADTVFAVSRQKKDRLRELMREAALHYHSNLKKGALGEALDYLTARGLAPMMARFGLGASTGFDEILTHLRRKGFSDEEMIEAGMASRGDKGLYDNFAFRLIFPIINSLGDVVAFGGRRLGEGNAVKYYNSRNTLLFEKSKTIYGINFLKKKKQVERKELTPIIVEGYIDVISLHMAGFDTAVASMGTALTKSQCRMLKGYGENIIISYDGDSAGQEATMKGLDLLQAEGFSVRVCELPDGLDPDDVIKKRGKEAYQKLLDEALPLLDFKLKTAKSKFDLATAVGKRDYCIAASAIIGEVSDPVVVEEYLRLLSSQTGYTYDTLKKQSEKGKKEEDETGHELAVITATQDILDLLNDQKQFLLHCWYAQKPFLDTEFDYFSVIDTDYEREALVYFQDCKKDGKKPSAGTVLDIYGEEKHNEAGKMMDLAFEGNEEYHFNECIQRLKLRQLEMEKERLYEEYERAATQKEKEAILKQIKKTVEKTRERKG